MGKAGRRNKAETESRRRQVWELKLRGMPHGTMAKVLGVSANTITQDIQAIRQNHSKYVKGIDVDSEFGDALAKFDHLFNAAILEYSAASKKSEKASFMHLANASLEKKLKFMMDTGMVPKAVQEIKGEFTVDGVDIRKASIEELKNKRDAILSRLPVAAMSIGQLNKEENSKN